jgi:hypothetical protein
MWGPDGSLGLKALDPPMPEALLGNQLTFLKQKPRHETGVFFLLPCCDVEPSQPEPRRLAQLIVPFKLTPEYAAYARTFT